MKNKGLLSTILLLLLAVFLSGCWDRMEVDELAIVLGMGIDRIPGKKPIQVTVQVANPAVAMTSPVGGGGGAQKPFLVMTSQGKSVYEAVLNFNKISPRRMLFSHNKILVFGNDLAKEGISETLDFFERDREARRTTWVVVADKTAKEILEATLPVEDIPARGLDAMMGKFLENAFTNPINRNEFFLRLKSVSKVPFAPYIELKGKQITIEKTAIFKNNRLIGLLNQDESRGLLWLLSKLKGGNVFIPFKPDQPGQGVNLTIVKGKSTITPVITTRGITMKIRSEDEANIREEEDVHIALRNLGTFQKLEEEAEKILKARLKKTIAKAQKTYNADFIGFADEIHNYSPVDWRRVEKDWDRIFPTIKYELALKVHIKGYGIIKDSVRENIRKE